MQSKIENGGQRTIDGRYADDSSVGSIKQQIPDTVAEAFTALLEFGHWTTFRFQRETIVTLGIGQAFGIRHHFHHVFGVVFPVCGQVQNAPNF
jgi:hypothetical protein